MMEITDHEGRNFEQILESVLVELNSEGNYEASGLLLAAALAQAAKVELLTDMGEQLVGSGQKLRTTLDALETELCEQGLGRRWGVVNGASLVTHHSVVAEAFVSIGTTSPRQRGLFIDVCHELAATDHLDERDDVPSPHFRVLNAAVNYLIEGENYEQAGAILTAWIALDPERRNFLAMHRLGVCLQSWASASIAATDANTELIVNLLDASRRSFREAIEVVLRLRAEPSACPPRMRKRLVPTELQAYHAWAVVEDIAGQQLEHDPSYVQSAYLALLSMKATGTSLGVDDRVGSCSQLVLVLIHLHEYGAAASLVSTISELRPHNYTLNSQRAMLRNAGQRVPEGGVSLLDGALASVIGLVSEKQADLRWPATGDLRTSLLAEVIEGLISWVPEPTELLDLQTRLKAPRAGDEG